MINNKLIGLAIAAIAASNLTGSPSVAQGEGLVRQDVKLVMTMSGIPVGKLAFSVTLDDGTYKINGSARTYGATRLFSDAKGYSISRGSYEDGGITVVDHNLQYRSGKKRGSVNIQFERGNVKGSKSVPAVRYKAGTVKIEPAHLRSVLDPVSAAIVVVAEDEIDNAAAICNRTLPIYDGKSRYDLRMKLKGIRKVTTKGFSGKSYVCSARYVPVAGHRPFKKHIKRLAANKSIEIALARIGHTPVYMIIQFSVKTRFGKVIGKASYFKTQNN